jgi:AcrR family transcriptional regulator
MPCPIAHVPGGASSEMSVRVSGAKAGNGSGTTTGGGRRRRSAIPSSEVDRPDRRREILVNAERLFAEFGYNGVSIRDIASAANVPIALVGYYFGRKEELFTTIFEHRLGYIEERIVRLKTINLDTPDPVLEIVCAWAEPAVNVRSSASGEAFSLLVARSVWDQGSVAQQMLQRYYDPLAEVFIETMMRALPNCDRVTIVWGYEYAIGALLMHLADRRVERLSAGHATSGDPTRLNDLVSFIASGFRALAKGAPEPDQD